MSTDACWQPARSYWRDIAWKDLHSIEKMMYLMENQHQIPDTSTVRILLEVARENLRSKDPNEPDITKRYIEWAINILGNRLTT